jgi:hypothetical protein
MSNFVSDGADTLMQADTRGDRNGDMETLLQNHAGQGFAAGDFVL